MMAQVKIRVDVVEIENKKLNEMIEVLGERVEEYEKRMSEE